MAKPLALRGLATLLSVISFAMPIESAPEITPEIISNYLMKKQSPLSQLGGVFVDSGRGHDVDPRLIIAIAGAETTFGKHLCAPFNAWNWIGSRPCAEASFPSWEHGIRTVTKSIRRYYLQQERTTIPLIGKKYCAESCTNWERLVTLFYRDELGGDVDKLSYRKVT